MIFIVYTLYCKFKKCIYQNKIFFRRRSKRETNVTENIEYDDADYYDSNEGGVDAENDDTRIVNGYAAGKRPWLVLIITNNEGMCGGSLINHKYVQQNTNSITCIAKSHLCTFCNIILYWINFPPICLNFHRFVLTAAHCFCPVNAGMPCKVRITFRQLGSKSKL